MVAICIHFKPFYKFSKLIIRSLHFYAHFYIQCNFYTLLRLENLDANETMYKYAMMYNSDLIALYIARSA